MWGQRLLYSQSSLATVLYLTSGLDVIVAESPTEVEGMLDGSGPIGRLTLPSGDPLFLRVDRLTHWHEARGENASTPTDEPEATPRAKPRYGRELPRTA